MSENIDVPPPKKLRIHSINDGREYAVCRFPVPTSIDQSNGLNCAIQNWLKMPLSIRKDLIRENQESRNTTLALADAANAPLRVRDSSSEKSLVCPCPLPIDSYFVLIDNPQDNSLEVFPLSKWYNFEIENTKTIKKLSEEEAELKARAALEKELELTARMLERAKNDDEEKGEIGKMSSQDGVFGVDLGVKKHMGRMQKKYNDLVMQRREDEGHNKIDENNSALCLGVLRKTAANWDFDGDLDNTDDEEDLNAPDDQIVEKEEEEEDESMLTSFGQTVKQLLVSQEIKDVEDELAQYSDDENDGVNSSEVSTASKKEEVVEPETSAVEAGTSEPQNLHLRVIRKLQQNGGRMNIKQFMSAFKLKNRDNDFRHLQKIVKAVCSAQTQFDSQGNKVKYIQLKSEFNR